MKKAKSIKEAVLILDELLNKADEIERNYILQMKGSDDMIAYHSTVGRDIRNQWGIVEH